MNFIKKHAWLIALATNISYCAAQQTTQNYTKTYDLDFATWKDSTVVYDWNVNSAYALSGFGVGIKDASRQLLGNMYFAKNPFFSRLRLEQEQRILLPSNACHTAEVSFQGKGKFVRNVLITLEALDYKENVLHTDTLNYVPSEHLKYSAAKKLNIERADMLNVRIKVDGYESRDAYMAYSKLNILIDGKPLDDYPVRQYESLAASDIPPYTAINADGIINMEKIDEIKNKKIIGLGEFVINNHDIRHLIYQMMTQAIERMNCKLILIERDFEKTLAYNRYIQNKNFELNSSFVVDAETMNFLKKLKQYNAAQSSKNKVHLYGLRYNNTITPSEHSGFDIFKFITCLNAKKKNRAADELSLLLIKRDFTPAIKFINANRSKLKALLTNEEIDNMLYILDVSRNAGSDLIARDLSQDSIMFKNADYVIKKFAPGADQKVFVNTHASHLNLVSGYPSRPCTSFGHFMKEAYADNYSPLAVLTNSNKNSTIVLNESQSVVLSDNCIENVLASLNVNTFYTPVTSVFSKPLLLRFSQSYSNMLKQEAINLYERFKGLLFVKNTESTNVSLNEKTTKETRNIYMTALQNRDKLINSIKQRLGVK